MRLTKKELEIMALLWNSPDPMTASELVEASDDRTWKETSIWGIMKTLERKAAVIVPRQKPTGTNYARAYQPAFSIEEYTLASIADLQKSGKDGVPMNYDLLIDGLKKMKKEKGK